MPNQIRGSETTHNSDTIIAMIGAGNDISVPWISLLVVVVYCGRSIEKNDLAMHISRLNLGTYFWGIPVRVFLVDSSNGFVQQGWQWRCEARFPRLRVHPTHNERRFMPRRMSVDLYLHLVDQVDAGKVCVEWPPGKSLCVDA